MTVSAIWFCLLLLVAAAFLALGRWLGDLSERVSRVTLIVSLGLIALAAVPRFQPTMLHTALPLSLSIYLEGLLATFPWMMLSGLAWSGRLSKNLKRATWLLIVLGLVYFLFGGVWMVLPNIRPYERETRTAEGVTLQSRTDACVPAACATALRRMGIPTTEAEMCHVVQAKIGRGSTLARAAYGLGDYLEGQGIEVSIRDLSADEVVWTARPDKPVLVVIRSNFAADHMVAVLGRIQRGVVIANPSPGAHGGVSKMAIKTNYGFEMFLPEDFAKLYRGGAIVFEMSEEGEEPVAE